MLIQALQTARPAQITDTHTRKLAVVYVRSSVDDGRSVSAQRDLAELARRWGWPKARILVIDCDLGLPGAPASNRSGFLHLMALTTAGEVGVAFVLDMSRLSRRPDRVAHSLHVAQRKGTLICANGIVR